MGGSEAKGGLFQSAMDENSINFHVYGNNNKKFEEAKQIIEEKISGIENSRLKSSELNDLEKLADLKIKGDY